MAPQTPAQPLARVKKIARIMRVVIWFGIAFELVGLLAVWLHEPWTNAFVVSSLGLAKEDITLTNSTRLAGLLICLVPGSVVMLLFADALALFRSYATGEIFSVSAVQRLRSIASRILTLGAFQPFVRTVLILDLTFNNPPGHRLLSIGFNSNDYMTLAFGGLMLAISWAMVEAARAVEENERFV